MSGVGKSRILRILCAEDHELICEVLKKALSGAGHDVECVFDGQAAWERLSANPLAFDLLITDHQIDGQAAWERLSANPLAFDVLITDHQMPHLSGLELVRKLRETAFAGWIDRKSVV